jgi:hypothetical protein
VSEGFDEQNLALLRAGLQQAALPAERQIARLKGFDVPFEVADDVCQQTLWLLQSTDVKMTDQQRSSLIALDNFIESMSGQHNARLWTDDALRSRPEWEEVRQRARNILGLFQWPLEDKDDPGVETV